MSAFGSPHQVSAGRPSAGFVPAAIPMAQVWPWLLFIPVCLLAIYFVGAEEGATALFKGMYIHEFVHDGRHLLGFPCH